MAAPTPYTPAEYARALANDLPQGAAWNKDVGSQLWSTLQTLTQQSARVSQDACTVVAEAFPPTTLQQLDVWEASLGLPDPCLGADPTVQQRVNQVVARFTNSGGLSIAFFESYAAALGYTITIQELAPFRPGFNAPGDGSAPAPLDAWFTWVITVPAAGLAVAQCEFASLAPAQTIMQFLAV